MIIRNVLLFICLFCLFLPAYAQDAKIFIDVQYKGSDKAFNKKAPDLVKEEFLKQGKFEIIDSKNNTDYVLSCKIEEKKEELILSLEITGDNFSELIVKKDKKENGIKKILQEGIDYINRKIFPLKIFHEENEDFLTEKTMRDYYGSDIINRSKEPPIRLFDPLNEKLFRKKRFHIFPSIEVSFPVNLLDEDVNQVPSYNIPVHFYIFTTELFMVSLMAEIQYLSFSTQVTLHDYNQLYIFAYGGGFGICFPLPFYNKIGLHLNVSGGSAISIITSELTADTILDSYDPFVHASFDIEHTITKIISFSVRISYIWIEYYGEGEDLHLFQSGVGFGLRF